MENDAGVVGDLKSIIASFTIHSPAEYSYCGKRIAVTISQPRSVDLGASASASESRPDLPISLRAADGNPLLSALQMHIYEAFYCRRRDRSYSLTANHSLPNSSSDAFIQKLSASNKARETWQEEWQIYNVHPSGLVYARKGDKKQMFWRHQYILPEGVGMNPVIGMNVRVFLAKEAREGQPGFYFALSEVPLEEHEPWSFVRLYWNISAEGIFTLLEGVSNSLNRFRVPYRFKCLSQPSGYVRADAAVLFINKRFYTITARLLIGIYESVARFLHAETPMFSKHLLSGLALAEDPGNGESFGSNRCRLVAEGLWNAFAKNLHDDRVRLDEVWQYLAANGVICPDTYLSPACVNQYGQIAYDAR